MNPAASRNLATHSKEVLPLKEAAELMCMVLLHMYKNLKKKMEPSGDENKESEETDKSTNARNTALSSIENVPKSGK